MQQKETYRTDSEVLRKKLDELLPQIAANFHHELNLDGALWLPRYLHRPQWLFDVIDKYVEERTQIFSSIPPLELHYRLSWVYLPDLFDLCLDFSEDGKGFLSPRWNNSAYYVLTGQERTIKVGWENNIDPKALDLRRWTRNRYDLTIELIKS